MKIFTKIVCSRSSPSGFIEPALTALAKEVNDYRQQRNISRKDVKWLQSLSKDQLVITAIVG